MHIDALKLLFLVVKLQKYFEPIVWMRRIEKNLRGAIILKVLRLHFPR